MFLSLLALAVGRFQAAEIPPVAGLGITGVTQGGRMPTPIDTVQSLIVEGKWKEPKVGETVVGARGDNRAWIEAKANKDGVFEGPETRGGYVYVSVDSDVEKPMLLHASGD